MFTDRVFIVCKVSAMDHSIGLLLDALRELDVEKNTLVLFTSDNGHEQGAGAGSVYKEGKRSLMVRQTAPILIILFPLASFY